MLRPFSVPCMRGIKHLSWLALLFLSPARRISNGCRNDTFCFTFGTLYIRILFWVASWGLLFQLVPHPSYCVPVSCKWRPKIEGVWRQSAEDLRARGNKSMGNVNNSYFSQNIVRMTKRICIMHGMVDDCVQNSSQYVCREEAILRFEAAVERKCWHGLWINRL